MAVAHDVQVAAGKADAVRSAIVSADDAGMGYLTVEQLETALSKAGIKFTRHQVITLHRRMDKERQGSIPTDEVLAVLGLQQC